MTPTLIRVMETSTSNQGNAFLSHIEFNMGSPEMLD